MEPFKNNDIQDNNHKILNSDEITECPICLEDFEELNDKVVICGCGNKICLTCAKQTLIHSDKDPFCINCKRRWDRTFQYKYFGSTWINKDYKKHRKTLLLDKEKAQMPETQPFVKTYMKKEQYNEEIREITKKAKELKDMLRKLDLKKYILQRKVRNINHNGIDEDEDKEKNEERKKFIKKCPSDNCRGYLSTGYKCSLCSVCVCSKCHEIKGYTHNVEHECNPDLVKSVELIKKETKPCPSCSTPIYKLYGCDQMWCTECKIAFSWNTCKVVTGPVHNPHYYDWLRKSGHENIQNPGADICGGIQSIYRLQEKLRRPSLFQHIDEANSILISKYYVYFYDNNIKYDIPKYQLIHIIIDIHRYITHNQHTIIDRLRQHVNGVINNLDLRIRYLMNEINDKELACNVMKRDNIREKKISMLQILELFNVVCIEFINNIVNDEHLVIKEILDRLKYLYETRKYCNTELMNVAKNYKMKVYYIQNNIKISDNMKTHIEIKKCIDKDKTLNF